MCCVSDQCILCIDTQKEIIRIFSGRGREMRIAETLADHFWFRVCLCCTVEPSYTEIITFHFIQVEDFNDQPNGICLECWEKTEIFDRFYKSVQAAHLILLNSKYTKNGCFDDVEVKSENMCHTYVSPMENLTVESIALDPNDEPDISQDKGTESTLIQFDT